MQIETLKEGAHLSLFEIHFNDDETPYRVWSTDQKHAIKEAQKIAITVNLLFSLQSLNTKQGR